MRKKEKKNRERLEEDKGGKEHTTVIGKNRSRRGDLRRKVRYKKK